MNRKDLERAIEAEIARWPGVTVKFVDGGKHPKAKLTFKDPELDGDPLIVSVTYSGTPSDAYFGVHQCLDDMRRALRTLGAVRDKPKPSKDEDEEPYRVANEGREKRPDPVKGERGPVKTGVADKLVEAGAATDEQRAAAFADAAVAATGGGVDPRPFAEIQDSASFGPPDEPTDEEREAAAELVRQLRACGLIEPTADFPDSTVAEIVALAVSLVDDGIMFGLPDIVYHALPRLSASGISKLCVSPATFWKGSWLDPDRPELDEESTKAQVLGKAYHVARLEPHRFHETYVRQIVAGDFPKKGFLSSDDKVKAALKAAGAQQTVAGETTEERCERLLDTGYQGTIFPLEKARWERTVAGRIPLGGVQFDQIVADMERIRSQAEIALLLSNGEAEVSVFWTDAHGLKMKSRLDWLTASHWCDLKTFDNSRGKELASALADAVRYNRYYVQATVYRDAVEAIRTGKVHIRGTATDAQAAMVAAIQIRPGDIACWYIFNEKGGIPNLLARQFPFSNAIMFGDVDTVDTFEDRVRRGEVQEGMRRESMLHNRGLWEVDRAKRAFMLYSQSYNPGEPWLPLEPLGRFDDVEFSSYWLEGR